MIAAPDPGLSRGLNMNRLIVIVTLTCAPLAARAGPLTCEQLVAHFGNRLADVNCFASTDLTTQNPATTPADDSIPTLPPFAFTPQTDREKIAPSVGKRTPITHAVPGLQLDARIASDATGQARFLLRLPDAWNGSLVVAGASGTRSEFNGDYAWSDYVLQEGFAYASQNKGVLNFYLVAVNPTPPSDPLACRLAPSGILASYWVHFYDNDPGQPFTRWAEYMVAAGALARHGVEAYYGHQPRHTYAVGTSNGGYQVRRAVESAPDIFDGGGVDWEGTFVDEHAPNLLTDLPAAVLNYPDYATSGFSPTSTAALNMLAAGYPQDIVGGGTSLWTNYEFAFWEVTQCQWQKRLDPTYDTYGSGTGTYNYVARLSVSDVGANVNAFATTGRIQRPLITVAGTMDSLLPIDHHARAYARKVAEHQRRHECGDAEYRLYEVQNGNHIETYQDQFPQLELIEPHAQQAFDLLVQHVEHHEKLPESQCIPHNGEISSSPSRPGHCRSLFAP
jgi:3HB-oligomer hydrolase (3HBOH)